MTTCLSGLFNLGNQITETLQTAPNAAKARHNRLQARSLTTSKGSLAGAEKSLVTGCKAAIGQCCPSIYYTRHGSEARDMQLAVPPILALCL